MEEVTFTEDTEVDHLTIRAAAATHLDPRGVGTASSGDPAASDVTVDLLNVTEKYYPATCRELLDRLIAANVTYTVVSRDEAEERIEAAIRRHEDEWEELQRTATLYDASGRQVDPPAT